MSKQIPFQKIAIVGVGLIGGSLGLALKKKHPQTHVRGVGRNAARLETARKLGAVDDCATDISTALRDRDLVVLATPVEHILTALETLGPHLAPDTIVTDVGSTKRMICRKAMRHLPSAVEFVGGHPLAGREVVGVENSIANLFHDAPYIFCPHAGTRSETVQRLVHLAEDIGAHPSIMDPEEHDQIVAWTSQLPQMIATGLANVIHEKDGPAKKLIRVSGTGFRDVVRLSGSPFEVWKGILATNDDNIDLALETFIRQLEKMRADLKTVRLSYDFDRAVEFYRDYKAMRPAKIQRPKTED